MGDRSLAEDRLGARPVALAIERGDEQIAPFVGAFALEAQRGEAEQGIAGEPALALFELHARRQDARLALLVPDALVDAVEREQHVGRARSVAFRALVDGGGALVVLEIFLDDRAHA